MASLRKLLEQVGSTLGGPPKLPPGWKPGGLDESTGAIWEAPHGPESGVMDDAQRRALGQNRGRALAAPMTTATSTGPVVNPRDPIFDQPQSRPRMVAPPPTNAAIAAATPRMRDMIAKQQTPVATGGVPINEQMPMRDTGPDFSNPDRDIRTPFGSSGEVFGTGDAGRSRRATNMRDFVADDTQYLRELENKPRNWKDKASEFVRALNTNFNGPGQVSTQTNREHNIETARGAVGRDLAVEKSQQQSALGQLVPVQLSDGTTVMAPARGAGTLASQQQRIGQADEALELRSAGLKSQDRRRRAQTAIQIYNSGGANNPKTLAQLSKALELPADLEAKFNAGEVALQADDKGEMQLINKKTGKVESTGVKSYETTKEAGRNTRQERAATAAMQRTEALIKAGIGKLGDPAVTETTAAELEDQAQEAEELAKDLTDQGFPSQGAKAADRAVKLRGTITTLKEAANKARTAQGVAGAPAPKAGRTIEGAIEAFKKNKKVNPSGRAPTAEEVARMKAVIDAR